MARCILLLLFNETRGTCWAYLLEGCNDELLLIRGCPGKNLQRQEARTKRISRQGKRSIARKRSERRGEGSRNRASEGKRGSRAGGGAARSENEE